MLASGVLVQRLFDTFGGRNLGLGIVDRRFGQLGDPISGCDCVQARRPPEVSSRLPSSSSISDGGLSAAPFSVAGAPIRERSPKASVMVRIAW